MSLTEVYPRLTPESPPHPIPLDHTVALAGDFVSILWKDGLEATVTPSFYQDLDTYNLRGVGVDFRSLTESIVTGKSPQTNIDRNAYPDEAEDRIIHRISGSLGSLVSGTQLALKAQPPNQNSLTPDKSTPIKQFAITFEARRRQDRRAPAGINGCVFVNNVYGVFNQPAVGSNPREWLIMEEVVGGESIQNIEAEDGSTAHNLRFSSKEHPALAAIIAGSGRTLQTNFPQFADLGRAVARQLGYPRFNNAFDDFHGGNILVQDLPDGPRYTLIDIG